MIYFNSSAKVIELVQPGVSTSRNRKINRDFHNNVRKKQHSSLQKHKNDYDYEYDDKKRSEYRRHNRECVSDYQGIIFLYNKFRI